MQKEIRTILNETQFTNLCKKGYITVTTDLGKTDITFTKIDIGELTCGNLVEKEQDDVKFLYILQDIGLELIGEIVKRSPLFSDIAPNVGIGKTGHLHDKNV